MSSANVTPQQILDAIQRVPEVRWPEVLQTIERLQTNPAAEPNTPTPVRSGADLRGSALIGVWADRTDIVNSREFAKDLRRQAEQREQGPSDPARH
jgi:hypothetical protein